MPLIYLDSTGYKKWKLQQCVYNIRFRGLTCTYNFINKIHTKLMRSVCWFLSGMCSIMIYLQFPAHLIRHRAAICGDHFNGITFLLLSISVYWRPNYPQLPKISLLVATVNRCVQFWATRQKYLVTSCYLVQREPCTPDSLHLSTR